MASLSPFWDFFDLAINQIAKTGLSSLQVIYYFESLFSRGIGAATAILAANKGYSICLNYLNDEKSAFKVRDEILNLGAKCIAVRADVSSFQ